MRGSRTTADSGFEWLGGASEHATDAADKAKKVAGAREWCANLANVANQS